MSSLAPGRRCRSRRRTTPCDHPESGIFACVEGRFRTPPGRHRDQARNRRQWDQRNRVQPFPGRRHDGKIERQGLAFDANLVGKDDGVVACGARPRKPAPNWARINCGRPVTGSACSAAITAHNAYGKPVASLTFASAASAASPSLSTLKAVPNSGSCVTGETKGRTPPVDPLQLAHLATFGIGQMVGLNAR